MENKTQASVWHRIRPGAPAPDYVTCGVCRGLFSLNECRIAARTVAVAYWPGSGGISEQQSEALRAGARDLQAEGPWRLLCPNSDCSGELRREGGDLEPASITAT